jgi:hypothetical protein
MVIVAILIGGEMGGLGGMFLAVPVAGVLRILALHLFPRYALAGEDVPLAGASAPLPSPAPPPPSPSRERAAQGGRR